MGITRLRLARFGCRNRPFYRVVAIDSRKAREAKPIEYLGTYDPVPYGPDGVKEVRLKIDRVKHWLATGAQPSDRVAYLLWRAGMMPPPPLRYSPQQSIPKKVRREAEKAKKGFHTATTAALNSALPMRGGAATQAVYSSMSGIFGRSSMLAGRQLLQ